MPGNLDSDTSPEEWASGAERSGQSDDCCPRQYLATTTMKATGEQGRTLKALRADNVTVWVPRNRLRIMKAKGGSVESYFRPPPGSTVPSGTSALSSPHGLRRERSQESDATTPTYARISRRHHSPLRSLSYTADTSTDFHNGLTNPAPPLFSRRPLERQKTITESAESINHMKQDSSENINPAGPRVSEPLRAGPTDSSCQHHEPGSFSRHNPPCGTATNPRSLSTDTSLMQRMQTNGEHLLLAPPSFAKAQRSTSAGNVYETVKDNSHSEDKNCGSSNKNYSDHLLHENYTRRARSVSPRPTGSRVTRDTTTYKERLKDSSSQVDIQHTHFHRNITASCDHEAREEESEMSVPTRVILLACGSFNPVTNMHLRMFELARDALHQTGIYRVVGGIISPVSDAYDKQGLQPATHRCAMLKLALKSSDWIRLDTWECERDTWSPTVEVLRHQQSLLQSTYNANLIDGTTKRRKIDSNLSVDSDYSSSSHQNNGNLNGLSPVVVKLLCGADLLESFAVPDLWKPEDKEEIVKNHGIVCISRAGTNPEKFIYESDLLSNFKNNLHLVTEWMHNDISSTKIRRALFRGESVKYLVQDSVIDYVIKNKLYGAGENKCQTLDLVTKRPISVCEFMCVQNWQWNRKNEEKTREKVEAAFV